MWVGVGKVCCRRGKKVNREKVWEVAVALYRLGETRKAGWQVVAGLKGLGQAAAVVNR